MITRRNCGQRSDGARRRLVRCSSRPTLGRGCGRQNRHSALLSLRSRDIHRASHRPVELLTFRRVVSSDQPDILASQVIRLAQVQYLLQRSADHQEGEHSPRFADLVTVTRRSGGSTIESGGSRIDLTSLSPSVSFEARNLPQGFRISTGINSAEMPIDSRLESPIPTDDVVDQSPALLGSAAAAAPNQ